MARLTWLLPLAALALAACGDDSGTKLPPAEPLSLDGLDAPVQVLVDDRAMPHIYAKTVHDLQVVEGYLMAQDRFAQMDFIRRSVTGRLAEVAGALQPSLISSDEDQRFLGFAREGQAIYDWLPSDDPDCKVAEAFVDGVNQYIDKVLKSGHYETPRGNEALALILSSTGDLHWKAADIFALARFQAWNLSYDADSDIARTAARAGVVNAFPAGSPDGHLAARAGLYADWFTDKPARARFTRDDGFPNLDSDTGSRARLLPADLVAPPDPQSLAGAERFFARVDSRPVTHRDPHIGSNSWVVSGDHTASGNPILSNDPHLSLIAPPVWWYVHLDTARAKGERAIESEGVAFAGLPGVVLGFNRKLAWSATTTGYDVTDVYDEQVTFRNDGTAGAPIWVPVTVRFRGADVPVQVIHESIAIQTSSPEDYVVYVVPHHGPIIPDSIVEPSSPGNPTGRALSVRYTGHTPTNELAFFSQLLDSSTFAEVETAQDNFRVGSQNFSEVSATEGIRWSTEARIPQRDARACTFAYDAGGVPTGVSPQFVLDGASGDFEWTTDLDDRYIPHEVNPARGYIATSNQDNVGVTADGNPCNDAFYLGGDFDVGYRQARIRQRLDALVERGGITPDDMVGLQGESTSILGEAMRAPIVAAIDHALGNTADDPTLAAYVTSIGATGRASLMEARTRLAAWSFATPHGVGATDATEIADSVGTTVFNLILERVAPLAFDDEANLVRRRPGTLQTARALEWAMTSPQTMATYRTSYAGVATYNDSVLWDNLGTAEVETRDRIVAQAVVEAMNGGTSRLGTDVNQWRWGRLHTVRFSQIVPALDNFEQVSVPPEGDPTFPDGFPRHGDLACPDASNFGIYNATDFSYGAGPSQRLVVEMTPDGPIARNALPGGQSEDPDSPHHADEAEHWRVNEQPPLYFDRDDVEKHAVSRLEITSP